jgi:hypothetical protein
MKNLVLITSIIDTPNTFLKYPVKSHHDIRTHSIRSVYSRNERFEQTKNTIKLCKEKIPNCKILIVECTDLTNHEYNFFTKNSHFLLNLYNNEKEKNKIYSDSKGLGESTMTINAINFILKENIDYDNIFKISGRYQLNDYFNYILYENDKCVVRIEKTTNFWQNHHFVYTFLYKLHKNYLIDFRNHLINNMCQFKKNEEYETICCYFFMSNTDIYINLKILGITCYIAPTGSIEYK